MENIYCHEKTYYNHKNRKKDSKESHVLNVLLGVVDAGRVCRDICPGWGEPASWPNIGVKSWHPPSCLQCEFLLAFLRLHISPNLHLTVTFLWSDSDVVMMGKKLSPPGIRVA